MKCRNCRREFAGAGGYCSERCQKQGEAAERLTRKTRIPFWVMTGLAGAAALMGVVFLFAESVGQGFLAFGAAAVLEGLALTAMPRGRCGRNTLSQISGGVLFALGVICILLWR